MDFVKMEGLGNDFVVLAGPLSPTASQIAAWCDRRRGIGADGVLVVSDDAGGVRMEYWNADGSAAEMCGNGLRCVARYARDRGMASEGEFVVNTAVGPRRVTVAADSVRAEIGPVQVGAGGVEIAGYRATRVSVGNPHAVVLVEDCYAVPVAAAGPLFETDPAFPGGVNAEFATVIDFGRIALRGWERGAGETLACGTGAVAAVAAAREGGLVGDAVVVHLPGGDLKVEIVDGIAWIEGPARTAYRGTL
jgi:diaminopimelate epimerase